MSFKCSIFQIIYNLSWDSLFLLCLNSGKFASKNPGNDIMMENLQVRIDGVMDYLLFLPLIFASCRPAKTNVFILT